MSTAETSRLLIHLLTISQPIKNKVQTKSSQPKSNYVIGIKDKIYFYESPDYGSQTSVYFVKGQKAKVVEIMDENLDNEFLHVNFEYKGRVTDGYILYEDIKFE